MKNLIIGASGLVGGYLYKALLPFGGTLGTCFSEDRQQGYLFLDIRDKESLRKVFRDHNPEVVFCPAAIPNVEYCEAYPDESRTVNINGIQNVINESKHNKAKFVFFSSDYVFDGKNGPYTEEDLPSPLNEYGRQKLEIERLIRKELSDYIIVRTTVVYGWEKKGKNFVMQMLKNLGRGVSIRVPSDQFGSPTYAKNLSEAVRDIVRLNQVGTFNIAGNEVINRYEFARIVCEVFNFKDNLLIPIKTVELNQKAKRPLKAGFNISKLSGLVKTVLLPPIQGLREMKKEKLSLI